MKHENPPAYLCFGVPMLIRRFALFVVLAFLAAASQTSARLEVAHYDHEALCLYCEDTALPQIKTTAVRKSRPSNRPVAAMWIARNNFRDKPGSDTYISPSSTSASVQHFCVLLI